MKTFTQLNARLKNFLNSWLLVLGLKECLVECVTSFVKSEVILPAATPTYHTSPIHLYVATTHLSLVSINTKKYIFSLVSRLFEVQLIKYVISLSKVVQYSPDLRYLFAPQKGSLAWNSLGWGLLYVVNVLLYFKIV